jgi:hypothetical protein
MFPSYLDFHRNLIGNDDAGRRITLTVWLWRTMAYLVGRVHQREMQVWP